MMYNPAGFDPQGLDMNADLGDPRRQEKLPGGYATQGQAVSAPYAEANMKAAEKTNPMNAVSQEPGKNFLADYLQKSGPDVGDSAFLNFGGKDSSGMSALEKKELLEKGELTEDMVQGDSVTDKMLLRQLRMQQMGL